VNRIEARKVLDRAHSLGLDSGRESVTHSGLSMRQVWEICNDYVVKLGHNRARLLPRFETYIEKNFVRADHSRKRR